MTHPVQHLSLVSTLQTHHSRWRQCLLMRLQCYDVAYIPAYPWSSFANTSTFKLQYSKDESRAGLDNGMHSTTLNSTVRSALPPTCPMLMMECGYRCRTGLRALRALWSNAAWSVLEGHTARSASSATTRGAGTERRTRHSRPHGSHCSAGPSSEFSASDFEGVNAERAVSAQSTEVRRGYDGTVANYA